MERRSKGREWGAGDGRSGIKETGSGAQRIEPNALGLMTVSEFFQRRGVDNSHVASKTQHTTPYHTIPYHTTLGSPLFRGHHHPLLRLHVPVITRRNLR
jgi:hypothetical protein